MTISLHARVLVALVAGSTLSVHATSALAAIAPEPGSAVAMVDQLPIRRITLYRSGVGSFERRGSIEGTSTIQMRFDVNQINDILKSMVVLDLSGKGEIGGVRYASRDPLAKRLSSFGVDISDEPSLSTLLVRLRGAKVTISVPDGQFSGVVIGGETRQIASGGSPTPIAVPFINLLTATGIKALNLALASNVEVLDKDLAAELSRALTAVADHRADRVKTVDVDLRGEGTREIMVGYVQEAPVWKASYRLVLPKADAKPAAVDTTVPAGFKDKLAMQGWAIIENTTDEDWNNIDLSLVSGQPVSFRMDLYQPLYAKRPMVPVPTVAGVAPRVYTGASVDLKPAEDGPALKVLGEAGSELAYYSRVAPVVSESAVGFDPTLAESKIGGVSGEQLERYGAASQATGAEAGEIFEYRIDHPITIERQRSAMLPIIASGISGRRVSIYSQGSGTHPMRGLELLNDSGLELLPGPIAVYDDGTYAGDSQIGHVAAGDKRLLAYSIDLEVDVQNTSDQTSGVERLRIVRGFLEMTSRTVSTQTYVISNKDASGKPRTVIFEHAKRDGWELKQPVSPYETTDSLYRFAVDVDGGKATQFKVVQQRLDRQQLVVASTGVEAVLSYRATGAKVSDAVVEAVGKAVELAAGIQTAERHAAGLAKEMAEIGTDQARIRQNLSSVDRASPLYAKYMAKLTEQETRVDSIGVESRKAAADLVAAQSLLAAYLANLDVE